MCLAVGQAVIFQFNVWYVVGVNSDYSLNLGSSPYNPDVIVYHVYADELSQPVKSFNSNMRVKK